MKKNLIVVSVLALALILSPLSGIGRGVFADEENTSVAVLSVSGNQSSDSSASTTPAHLPYDAPVEQIVDRLNEVLDNAAATDPDGNPNAVVWQLLGVIVQHRMADAMTESVEVREKMADLEKRYIEWYNIQVQEIEMGDAVKEVVDPDKVSIIGTAFDAKGTSDVTMQWKMDVVDKELKFIPSHSKLVSFDVEFYCNGEEQGNHTMWLPVTFTMPVPGGIDVDKLAIWHYQYFSEDKVVRVPIKFSINSDGTISFSETNFISSTFAFIEVSSSSEPGSDTPAGGGSGSIPPAGGESGSNAPSGGKNVYNSWQADVESQIIAADPGTIVKITKDQNIISLSNSVMQKLAKRGDVALEMEYTYDGVDYHIVIPAGLAVDDDIPWYGPLYLSAYYSGYALSENTAAPTSLYIVQSGDTLSKIARKHNTTVADLTMKNPQIKNVNSIKPGQIITIE